MIGSTPVISKEAYSTFVSFIFAAAMVAWGATFIGLNPIAPKANLEWSQDVIGLEYIAAMPGYIQLGGVLYGLVLICFYWIYAERIIAIYLPTSLLQLPLDFVALSVMAGAAAAWINERMFVFLTFSTLIFLFFRFIKPARREKKIEKQWGKRLMLHLVILYGVAGALLPLGLIFGYWVFGGEGVPRIDNPFFQKLYYVAEVGMVFGIGLTVWHAWFDRPLTTLAASPMSVLPLETYSPVRLPRLTPCYHCIPTDRLSTVAHAVLSGEMRYRELLRLHGGLASHLSHVHSYRDVETQAFIMAHHADDPSTDSAHEMMLRSMWVYLAHWFDDVFDYYRPGQLASMQLNDDFLVGMTVEQLDPRFKELWESAVHQTRQLPTWNCDLLELGMRRLMLGGPMFSPKCREQNAAFQAAHKTFVLSKIPDDTRNARVRALVENAPDRHLAYTSKVVVEIWDSFTSNATFPMSLLMGFFYAPGLLMHDYKAESDQGEISESTEDSPQPYLSTLEEAVKIITSLDEEEIQWMLKPVPMFICSFEKVLTEADGQDVLNLYSKFLDNNQVKRALGKR